jgi:competence protein ComEC
MPGRAPSEGVEAIFADVGQGDAALVRAGGSTLLIDGGGAAGRDLGAAVLRPMLARRGIERVDAALLSHADADHCLGLLDLSALMPIDEVWMAPGAESVRCAARLAARARVGARTLRAGDRLTLGGLEIEILHPVDAGADAANRESVVARVSAGGRRLLFLGDLPADLERRLTAVAADRLAADVIKVAHHGSAGSSSAELLRAAGARLAVVSAGARNPFGHPATPALVRLRASGARILRTDRDGEIVLRWQADRPWRIETPAAPRRVATERGGAG